MAQRSTVELLPEDVRHALERRLAESGFSNYSELTDWLKSQGYEISRSAVHRFGQKVERRFASIKASTEAARLIAEGASDEGDTRSEALMAMLQTELFDAMVEIGEFDDELRIVIGGRRLAGEELHPRYPVPIGVRADLVIERHRLDDVVAARTTLLGEHGDGGQCGDGDAGGQQGLAHGFLHRIQAMRFPPANTPSARSPPSQ